MRRNGAVLCRSATSNDHGVVAKEPLRASSAGGTIRSLCYQDGKPEANIFRDVRAAFGGGWDGDRLEGGSVSPCPEKGCLVIRRIWSPFRFTRAFPSTSSEIGETSFRLIVVR